MKTSRKALLTALCALLLVAASVFGTMAYLTDSESVKNTFTVGNVDISLIETDADDASKRTDEGNEYHLIPGGTYRKDPTVFVSANSEDAYVRMKVRVVDYDKLAAALPDSYKDDATGLVLLQYLCKNWDPEVWAFEGATPIRVLENATTEMEYEFRYTKVVEKEESTTRLESLFTHITVPGELTNAQLALLENVEINVTAEAIQAAGFENAADAWAHFPTTLG